MGLLPSPRHDTNSVYRGVHFPGPMKHIVYSPLLSKKNYKFPSYFSKMYKCPPISFNLCFISLIYVFWLPSILTMIYVSCFTRTGVPECLTLNVFFGVGGGGEYEIIREKIIRIRVYTDSLT